MHVNQYYSHCCIFERKSIKCRPGANHTFRLALSREYSTTNYNNFRLVCILYVWKGKCNSKHNVKIPRQKNWSILPMISKNASIRISKIWRYESEHQVLHCTLISVQGTLHLDREESFPARYRKRHWLGSVFQFGKNEWPVLTVRFSGSLYRMSYGSKEILF